MPPPPPRVESLVTTPKVESLQPAAPLPHGTTLVSTKGRSLKKEKEEDAIVYIHKAKMILQPEEYKDFQGILKQFKESKGHNVEHMAMHIKQLFHGDSKRELLEGFTQFVPAKHREQYEKILKSGEASAVPDTTKIDPLHASASLELVSETTVTVAAKKNEVDLVTGQQVGKSIKLLMLADETFQKAQDSSRAQEDS